MTKIITYNNGKQTITYDEDGYKELGLKLLGYNLLSEYYKSDSWKQFRLEILKERIKKCEACNTTKQIHLHHKTYEHLGQCNIMEKQDIVLLCKSCHKMVHDMNNRPFSTNLRNCYRYNPQHCLKYCTEYVIKLEENLKILEEEVKNQELTEEEQLFLEEHNISISKKIKKINKQEKYKIQNAQHLVKDKQTKLIEKWNQQDKEKVLKNKENFNSKYRK